LLGNIAPAPLDFLSASRRPGSTALTNRDEQGE
jgi:hypothetical protein